MQSETEICDINRHKFQILLTALFNHVKLDLFQRGAKTQVTARKILEKDST